MRIPTPIHAFLVTGLIHIGLALLADGRPFNLRFGGADFPASKPFILGSLALFYLFFAAAYWLAGRRVLRLWLVQLHYFLWLVVSILFIAGFLFFDASDHALWPAFLLVAAVMAVLGVVVFIVNIAGGIVRAVLRGGDDGRAEPPGPMVE